MTYPSVDLVLARRLERAEALAGAAYVDARRELHPHVGAERIEVAGVHAMFDGVDSPLTQTFGLGVFEPFLAPEFDQVENFFSRHGAPTDHEVCSFVSPDTLNLLSSRGYTPFETATVLVRPTTMTPAEEREGLTVRRIDQGESGLWARVAAEGWSSESAELAAMVEQLGAVITGARGVDCFLAELHGRPVAAGALNLQNGVALLAGASTIPSARRQGAQLALLHARLAFGAERGLGLAMVVTQPGSASQRNAVRQGFRPVYVRSKWRLQ